MPLLTSKTASRKTRGMLQGILVWSVLLYYGVPAIFFWVGKKVQYGIMGLGMVYILWAYNKYLTPPPPPEKVAFDKVRAAQQAAKKRGDPRWMFVTS